MTSLSGGSEFTAGRRNALLTRRALLAGAAASALGAASSMQLMPAIAAEETRAMLTRAIPATGETLPVIGLGTWQTFDVAGDGTSLQPCRDVLQALLEAGGRMIDSSPMYGRAEAVTGSLLAELKARDRVFVATKVWTSGERQGIAQMEASARKMAAPVVDLMQIHNLVDWRTHLRTLRALKESGKIRYIGITHYTTSAFDDLMAIMRAERIDFVQLPYSLAVREAEARLLPLALERGVAVIPNRPFDGGDMFSKVRGRPLPEWAGELDAASFGQVFLKYLLGHPAVTCVIPATAKASHMRDNAASGRGTLPGDALRRRIAAWWQEL